MMPRPFETARDESLIDQLRRRWAAEARADGRDDEARALEGDDLADDLVDVEALERAAEDELLVIFQRDVEREFVLVQLHEESQDDAYRGPRR